ncbi:MAG: ATP-binding domain-containing protein [Actinomycetota bacterium]|nr:ATP-binding domain-containing protein [Actinomycetota bacterium]
MIELVDNRRQNEAWERQALSELRSGSVLKAVAAYHQAGRVNLAPSADAARDTLVAHWWAARQQGTDAAMYALRRSDVDDLNRRARRVLRAAGLLGDDTLNVAGRELAVGDDIVCLRNDRRLDITNGTTATITAIDADTGAITVNLGGGNSGRVLPPEYLTAGHVAHRYATTVHKAQGATVDRAFVLGSDTLYREAGYTALSRARAGTDLYLVDTQPTTRNGREDVPLSPTVDLARRLQQSRAQQLASDHLQPHHERDTGLGL